MTSLKQNRRILTIVSEEEVGAGSAPAIKNEQNEVSNQSIKEITEETKTTNNEDQTLVVIEATNGEDAERQLIKMGRKPTSPYAVRIPDGTKIISRYSFGNCWNVKEITIPNSVLVIEEDALINCGLEEIVVPGSVVKIAGNPFYGNNLRFITVDKDNPVYDSRDNCNAIIKTKTDTLIVGSKNTVIPESVVKIETGAFSQGSIDHINIPKSIMEIAPGAIHDINIHSISVDNGNPVYDSRNGCNAIIITETDILIAGCSNTVIPDTVEKIGWKAFSESYLSHVVIPDSVKAIGDCAFSGCEFLETVIIGKAVQKIGFNAFVDCDCLETVILLGDEPEGYWKPSLPEDCEIIKVQ